MKITGGRFGFTDRKCNLMFLFYPHIPLPEAVMLFLQLSSRRYLDSHFVSFQQCPIPPPPNPHLRGGSQDVSGSVYHTFIHQIILQPPESSPVSRLMVLIKQFGHQVVQIVNAIHDIMHSLVWLTNSYLICP